MKVRYLKYSVVAILVIVALLHCDPVVKGEKINLGWIWNEIGFETALEEKTELSAEKQAIYAEELAIHPVIQFGLPENEQMQAFLYEGKEYGLLPEIGILFMQDGLQVRLTDAYGRYDCLSALGVIQKENLLYYAQAKEKKWLCLPGLFKKEGIFSKSYQLEYRKADLDDEAGWLLIAEEEYMTVRDEKRDT